MNTSQNRQARGQLGKSMSSTQTRTGQKLQKATNPRPSKACWTRQVWQDTLPSSALTGVLGGVLVAFWSFVSS